MAPDATALPFLLLSIRTEEPAALEEHAAFARFLGVDADELHRLELGTTPLPSIDLDDWAGIILGGGAFNASDPEETKSEAQALAERDLGRLLDEVDRPRLPVPRRLLRHRQHRSPPGRGRGPDASPSRSGRSVSS